MHPKSPKLLNDILEACVLIAGVAQAKTLRDYEQDRLLRNAVERNFEIIGEALNRISKVDPETGRSIPEHPAIIGFRNLLIHGYDEVDCSRVWRIMQEDVPRLQELVSGLLRGAR